MAAYSVDALERPPGLSHARRLSPVRSYRQLVAPRVAVALTLGAVDDLGFFEDLARELKNSKTKTECLDPAEASAKARETSTVP